MTVRGATARRSGPRTRPRERRRHAHRDARRAGDPPDRARRDDDAVRLGRRPRRSTRRTASRPSRTRGSLSTRSAARSAARRRSHRSSPPSAHDHAAGLLPEAGRGEPAVVHLVRRRRRSAVHALAVRRHRVLGHRRQEGRVARLERGLHLQPLEPSARVTDAAPAARSTDGCFEPGTYAYDVTAVTQRQGGLRDDREHHVATRHPELRSRSAGRSSRAASYNVYGRDDGTSTSRACGSLGHDGLDVDLAASTPASVAPRRRRHDSVQSPPLGDDQLLARRRRDADEREAAVHARRRHRPPQQRPGLT